MGGFKIIQNYLPISEPHTFRIGTLERLKDYLLINNNTGN